MNWNKNDCFFSGRKKVSIVWNNIDARKKSFISWKSLRVNLLKEDYDYIGALIKVEFWSQMVIEFDEDSHLVSPNELHSIYEIAKQNTNSDNWILIDPEWIQTICIKENDPYHHVKFSNIEYCKAYSYNVSEESKLNYYIQSHKNFKPIKIDIEFSIDSNTIISNCLRLLKSFQKCIIHNLKIIFIEPLEKEIISCIIYSLSKINRLDNLHLIGMELEITKVLMSGEFPINPDQKINIEGVSKILWHDLFELKSIYKNLNYINEQKDWY